MILNNPISINTLRDYESLLSHLEGVAIKLVPVLRNARQKNIPPAMIKQMVAESTHITVEQMESACRKTGVVEARFISMDAIIIYSPNMSLASIGALFGTRDHTAVIYAKQKVKEWLEVDAKFHKKYVQVIEYIEKTINQINHQYYEQSGHTQHSASQA